MYTAEEQAANRKKWIAVLRSGEYQQANGKLRDGDKFCCLGIACDISGLGEWIAYGNQETEDNILYGYKIIDRGYCDLYLPKETLPVMVMDWLGITVNGLLSHSSDYCGVQIVSLADANDEGMSFEEIADIIESDEIIKQ